MVSRQSIQINSILGGIAPSSHFSADQQVLATLGIDPDFPFDDTPTNFKPSGLLRPTAMEKFSGTNLNEVPLWIATNPKDNKVYAYLANGSFLSYDSSLTTETALTAITSSSGNGLAYYDNALYLAKNTDIARYHPLDGTPSVDQTYWTTTLGKSALSNTTYPTIRGLTLPNHVMHYHRPSQSLYICDVSDNKGVIHRIRTKKTTTEGDTDDNSEASALTLDFGEYPTALETYGTFLVIGAIQGTDTTIKQAPARVIFWDTVSSTIDKVISTELPFPLITAMKNVNGALYVWAGSADGGAALLRFLGGYSFEMLWYDEEAHPPLQGAVDGYLNRVFWGSWTTYPQASSVVYAFNSKRGDLKMGVHGVFTPSAAAVADNSITALKIVEHSSGSKIRPIIGWVNNVGGASQAQGLDKLSTTYGTSIFRSRLFRVGRPFKIVQTVIPLAQAVGANMTITPKIYVDDESSSTTLTTINSTNYSKSERIIIDNTQVQGKHNFFLELTWSGSSLLTVGLPITIWLDIEETI